MVALLCFGAVAIAGIVTPIKVTASVSPRHQISHPPYTFVTSGQIRFPSAYCPPGTTNPAYCTLITAKEACYGKISLSVSIAKDRLLARSKTTIKRTTGKVSSKCTYSIQTKLPKSDFTATSTYVPHQRGSYVHVSFHVKFLGNAVLNQRKARIQNVVAKLLQPGS